MPNFNTHWLVSILLRHSTPQEIRSGFSDYKRAANEFRSAVHKQFDAMAGQTSASLARKSFSEFKRKGFVNLADKFEAKLKKKSAYDNITCFSAYMLGACGPDFWTVVSKSRFGVIPDTAGIHFDLGHYNRTHHQFKVAIKRWNDATKANPKYRESLQYKVELSYFLGMATHIATDLVMHQLVNVYAGAYNLLDKKWESEHGALSGLKNLWNTHNKVEHFWDSYIRYRYIGDFGYIWKDHDTKNLLIAEPLWFPVAENMVEYVKRLPDFGPKSDLIGWLEKESNKLVIEKCFILPRIACDRILDKTLKNFIYDVVVDKAKGAYPKSDIFNDAVKESEHYQMKDSGVKCENKKLYYFASKNNQDTNVTGFNYLNYYVCPNLERLKKYGVYVFYHFDALKPFVDSAVTVGQRFLSKLRTAIDSGDVLDIGPIDHFWNLDTGLGLKVNHIISDTPKEVITQLNFVHITDFIKDAQIKYSGYKPNLDCMFGGKGRPKDKKATFKGTPSEEVCAFKTYEQSTPFDTLYDVEEEEFPEEVRYVQEIQLKNPDPYVVDMALDNFFDPVKKAENVALPAATTSSKEENKIQSRYIYNRLSLRIDTAIPHFCTPDNEEMLGFYLLGDSTMDSVQYAEGRQKEWLQDKQTKVHVFEKSVKSNELRLCPFKSFLLLNLENDKNVTRHITCGHWNNVINYKAHEAHYSRNYAIATGRRHVLHFDGDGQFWADKDFVYYTNVSPTEHIFFSLYLLVRTKDGCFDMLSKKKVQKKELDTIKKIDCLGFVKIVLFYTLDKVEQHYAAAQLDECYVDGLRVPVEWEF